MVPVNPVLDRPDDRHCADAQRDRSADKCIDKLRILRASRFALQPAAEPFNEPFEIQKFSDHTADDHGNDHHHGAGRLKFPVTEHQHVLQCAADADKHDSQRHGGVHRLPEAHRNASAENCADTPADDNQQDIYNCAKSFHTFTPSKSVQPPKYTVCAFWYRIASFSSSENSAQPRR